MNALRARTTALLLGLLLAVSCLRTQAQDQSAPPDSSAGNPSGATPQGEEVPSLARTPQNDRTPVSGVEDYRLDGLNLGRSFLLGKVDFTENYDTNSNSAASNATSQNDSITNLHGSLAVQWLSRKSALDLDYIFGALFYAKGTFSQSTNQQLNVTEKIYLRRWTLLLGNDFAFLPQSPLGLGGLGVGAGGFGGLPGLGGFGGGLTGFNPGFLPGQNVQGTGSRIREAVVGQGQYSFGPRSSANFSGTYGLLHFLDNGFLSSRTLGLRAGYDYELNPRQTISVNTNYNSVGYSSTQPGFFSQSFQVAYRRTITGRLSMLAEGGPQITHFATALKGPSNRLSWTMRSSLRYMTTRNSLELAYAHRLTEGSGLLVGADTDTLDIRFSRLISRSWTSSLVGQFNRNNSLTQTTSAKINNHFNSWLGGVTFQRLLGRQTNLQLSYTLSRQTSNTSVCAGSVPCGAVSLRQQIGLGLSWSSRPYSID